VFAFRSDAFYGGMNSSLLMSALLNYAMYVEILVND
jgi:hypothetical protein